MLPRSVSYFCPPGQKLQLACQSLVSVPASAKPAWELRLAEGPLPFTLCLNLGRDARPCPDASGVPLVGAREAILCLLSGRGLSGIAPCRLGVHGLQVPHLKAASVGAADPGRGVAGDPGGPFLVLLVALVGKCSIP